MFDFNIFECLTEIVLCSLTTLILSLQLQKNKKKTEAQSNQMLRLKTINQEKIII